MDKKKYLKIALIFICIISITLIGTYALKLWSSTDNTELTFRIGEYQTDSMICKASEDITVSNIGPVFDYMKDGEVIPFTILASSTNEEKLFINFNIESITSNLKEESFKYILLSSTDKVNYNEVIKGNFLNINSNDTLELISDYTINKTTYYKLIIYIDGNMENPISMQNGSITGNIEVCTDGVLLVTDEVLEAHKETKTDTISVNKEFSATGAVQNVTLNAGTYKLEVWGAQGGSYSTTYTGGKGGYSYGTLTLNNTTNLYVYVGKQGSAHSTTTGGVSAGGFNGGGSAKTVGLKFSSPYSYVTGGGGASDIRIGQDSLYARVIVAGGGSGSSNANSGYYGGGTTAGYGVSGYGGTTTTAGTNGSFGVGANAAPSSTNYKYASPGGGGGWYGGGSSGTNRSDSTNYRTYTGGGSGYVYTSSTASNYPSGNLLTSTYYLTNAATLAGNTSFISTSGGTETGHSGNGYAKITGNEIGTITYYTIPNLTGLTDLKVQLGTSVSLTEGTTLICENNTTTGCSITSISITDTSTLTEGTHVVTYTVKGANNKKYLFNRNIIIIANLDTSGANTPDLVDGLIPVMYNGSKWVKADSSNSNETYKWYDYDNKKWANAVLVTSTNRNTYQNASAGTTITESDILAYYVWIPRYKYKVWNVNKVIGTDSYSARTTGIDIVFENEKESTGTISCTYSFKSPSSSANSPNETCTGSNGDYYTHPAFTFGSDEIRGFWMGKFELTGSSSELTILPNQTILRDQKVSVYSTIIQDMQTSSNIYGLNTSRTNTDSHMITNYEWGAVAYLTNSKYGRCTNGSCTEVTINNCSSFITGIGADGVSLKDSYSSSTTCTTSANQYDGTKGILASTTGNITGVYDMNGGASEHVMGNMSSASGSYTFYPSGGSGFANGWYTTSTAKYITTYAYESSNNNRTNQMAYNRSRLGDATGEVVLSTGGNGGGWYSDDAYFPHSNFSWFMRGDYYAKSSSAGMFAFGSSVGNVSGGSSSRSILVSLSY